MTTAYITHPDCLRHDMGSGHPESPARLNAIQQGLESAGLWDALVHGVAPLIERSILYQAHDSTYVDRVFDLFPLHEEMPFAPDVVLNPYSLDAARRAAGAVCMAVDWVIAGSVDNAFCGVRPPGHHAETDAGMGFCVFNNVAVAAKYALQQHGLDRVAIVDFDVHHGNGTESIAQKDPRIQFCSSFQHPFYPYTELDFNQSNIVYTPLSSGTGGNVFRSQIEKTWWPALEQFQPQLLLISAGFDAHSDDPLAMLELTAADYFWVTRELKRLAGRLCNGRIVASLEGGYHLQALADSVCEHLRALDGR